jgi:hypothetical protein
LAGVREFLVGDHFLQISVEHFAVASVHLFLRMPA